MNTNTQQAVSFGRRLAALADAHRDQPAIIFRPRSGPERRLSWQELEVQSNQVARLLTEAGAKEGSTVVVGLTNCPKHYVVTFAVWKLGAMPLPLYAGFPDRERDALLDLATPSVVVADWIGADYPTLRPADLRRADVLSTDALPDRISDPSRALGSGGSTGRPKIIVSPGPAARVPGKPASYLADLGFAPRQTQLVASPLYHAAGFLISYNGLFDDNTLVLMEKFNAALAVQLIEQYRVESVYLPPILMQRIAALPDIRSRDLSSLKAVASAAAPCPGWLKRFWCELVGPQHVTECYGASEATGRTVIDGNEWLAHPGSVGRPVTSEVHILNPAGDELPRGEVGEIFMRNLPPVAEPFRYLGSPPPASTPDGFISVGDLGWVDADGYLYIADRRVDMIVSGGANIYAAEVEAALSEHAGVADVVVIGLPDPEWGKRVHAVIQPRDASRPPTASDLKAFCRERLAAYKAPRTYEFVLDFPRSDAGKIQRSAMVAERTVDVRFPATAVSG
jgi:bile acid-coenzyme A ligase